jgi:tetratricopeptide (TPR) repeat protein
MSGTSQPNHRRVAAIAGFSLFWAALFLALGLPFVLVLLVAATGSLVALYTWRGLEPLGRAREGAAQAVGTGRRAAGKGLDAAGRLRGLPWRNYAASLRAAGARAAANGVAGARTGRVRLQELKLKTESVRSRPPREREANSFDRWHEAWRLNEVSTSLRQQGRTTEALESSERALRIFRELGEQRGEAMTLNSMGLALARQGDVSGAIERYEQALVLLRMIGDVHRQGQVLANLGAVHRTQGHRDQADACWQGALERLDPGSPERERVEQLRLAS